MYSLTIKAIECGWANLEIVIDDQPILVCIENVPNDAFNDLLESAILVINQIDSNVFFPNGSQKETLTVVSLDSSHCRVTIGGYSEEMSVKLYIRAVLRLFDVYLHAHSKEEFDREWCNSFSVDYLERLRKKFKNL